jgi:hypothetical protein
LHWAPAKRFSIYELRDFPASGGLSLAICLWFRPPKFEFVINLKTAKALGYYKPLPTYCDRDGCRSARGFVIARLTRLDQPSSTFAG